MKILVTGAGGQLGLELAELLPERGHDVVALARAELDVADFGSCARALEEHAPDLVVNAAAYTNVDGAETETGAAHAGNVLGPRNLAQLCGRSGPEILHVGTNYVFDGRAENPYAPYDLPNPESVYGKTKLAGEEYVRDLMDRWYIRGRLRAGAQLRAHHAAARPGERLPQGQGRRVHRAHLREGPRPGHRRGA